MKHTSIFFAVSIILSFLLGKGSSFGGSASQRNSRRGWTTTFSNVQPHSSTVAKSAVATTSTTTADNNNNCKLTHIMLKVPDVNETMDFWVDSLPGASVRIWNPTGGSAFVDLIDAEDGEEFALEIVPFKSDNLQFKLGEGVDYIQVTSSTEQKDETDVDDDGKDPNGIRLMRRSQEATIVTLGLKTDAPVSQVKDFYSKLFGPKVLTERGSDDECCVLTFGRTCLEFRQTTPDVELLGNCLDHLVVSTTEPVDELYTRAQTLDSVRVFMTPVDMFGSRVMGVLDPSGYKIVIASRDD